MANKTTRKSKLNKKPIESNLELTNHSKKLASKELIKYFKIAIPIFLLQLTAQLSMLAVSREAGSQAGIILISIDAFITLTFFVVFDAVPARQFKKKPEIFPNLSANQIKVFYNTIKIRTIIRTIANIIMTCIALIITLLLFVI